MFDVDDFIADCRTALDETNPRRAVREILERATSKPGEIVAALGRDEGGLEVVHSSPDLTVLNVTWAPNMVLPPHDHRMWAAIAVYGGGEDNTLYQRGPERITAAGGRELREGDVLVLGADAIHGVRNAVPRFTGAIHVYGGDFVNQPRSQWDPDTLVEQDWDLAYFQALFAKANADWAAQLGHDLDDDVT